MDDHWTAGPGTFQHDGIERAVGVKLGGEAGVEELWEPVSGETILDLDPDWIVHKDTHDEPPIDEELVERTAMQTEQIVVVDANLFNQAGPLFVAQVQLIAEAILEIDTDDKVADEVEDTDAEALPGFGVVAAGIVVGFGLFLYRRR